MATSTSEQYNPVNDLYVKNGKLYQILEVINQFTFFAELNPNFFLKERQRWIIRIETEEFVKEYQFFSRGPKVSDIIMNLWKKQYSIDEVRNGSKQGITNVREPTIVTVKRKLLHTQRGNLTNTFTLPEFLAGFLWVEADKKWIERVSSVIFFNNQLLPFNKKGDDVTEKQFKSIGFAWKKTINRWKRKMKEETFELTLKIPMLSWLEPFVFYADYWNDYVEDNLQIRSFVDTATKQMRLTITFPFLNPHTLDAPNLEDNINRYLNIQKENILNYIYDRKRSGAFSDPIWTFNIRHFTDFDVTIRGEYNFTQMKGVALLYGTATPEYVLTELGNEENQNYMINSGFVWDDQSTTWRDDLSDSDDDANRTAFYTSDALPQQTVNLQQDSNSTPPKRPTKVSLGQTFTIEQFKNLGPFYIEKKLVLEDFSIDEEIEALRTKLSLEETKLAAQEKMPQPEQAARKKAYLFLINNFKKKIKSLQEDIKDLEATRNDTGCKNKDLSRNIVYPVLVTESNERDTIKKVYCAEDITIMVNGKINTNVRGSDVDQETNRPIKKIHIMTEQDVENKEFEDLFKKLQVVSAKIKEMKKDKTVDMTDIRRLQYELRALKEEQEQRRKKKKERIAMRASNNSNAEEGTDRPSKRQKIRLLTLRVQNLKF